MGKEKRKRGNEKKIGGMGEKRIITVPRIRLNNEELCDDGSTHSKWLLATPCNALLRCFSSVGDAQVCRLT